MSLLRRNITFNIFGQGAVIILGFVSFKYIYTGLGEDALGLIYFALMMSVLFSSALDMGLSKTTMREVAAHKNNDPDYVIKLTQTFSLLYLSAYILIIILFVVSLPMIIESWINLTSMDKELAYYVLLIMGTTSLLAIPKAFMTSICVGLQRMDINNSIEVSVAVIQQLGTILMLMQGESIITIAYWLAFINVLRIAIYYTIIARILSLKALFPKFSFFVIKKIKTYTTKMAWVSLLLVIHKQLDKVLISKLLPIGVLGIYSFTYNSIAKTSLITNAVAQAVFPSFSEMEKQDNNKKLLDQFFTLQDLLVFGTIPIFSFAIFFSVPVFTFLLDAGKAETLQLPIFFLCVGFYLNATLRLVSTYVSAIGKPEYIISVTKFLLLVSLPITVILIMEFGIIGAAMSWVLYYIFAAIYMVPRVYKGELHQPAFIWFKSVAVAVSLASLVYFPTWYVANVYLANNLMSLILLYGVGTLLYCVLALNFAGKRLRLTVVNYIPVVKTVIFARDKG